MSKITFTERAFAEYLYWQSQDKKTLKRINALLKDISRSPYEGIGKPEGLKENLSGYWSRRIDDVNRLVYRIADVGSDVQGSLRDVTGGEIGRGDQSTRGGKGVVSAAADGEDAVVRLDDFTIPGNQEEVLPISHDEKGFELLQHVKN